MVRGTAWLGIVAALLGCGGQEAQTPTDQCIDENPPSEPFGVGDVAEMSMMPAAPGAPAAPAPSPTAQSIAVACASEGGTTCNAKDFISRGAAVCLAERHGFATGLQPWEVALVYHSGYERVVWNVMNVLYDNGADGFSGGWLTIDAVDGSVLGEGGYSAMP